MDNYYLSLKEFDYIYYKNYNKKVYDYEKEILKLFNSEINVEEFNIDNKGIQYQILGDYEYIFNRNNNKSNHYHNKAIEFNNNQSKIKQIINMYSKYEKEYYINFINILNTDKSNYIFYYLSNIFEYVNDINFTSNINKIILYYININIENINYNILDDENNLDLLKLYELYNNYNNKNIIISINKFVNKFINKENYINILIKIDNIERILESNIQNLNNYQLNKICKENLYYLYQYYNYIENDNLINKIENILKFKNDNFYILDKINILINKNKTLKRIKPYLKSTIINFNNFNNINDKHIVNEYFLYLLNNLTSNTCKRYQKILLHKYFITTLNKCNNIKKKDFNKYKDLTKCNIIDIFDQYFHLIELNYIYFDYINIHSIYLLSNKKYNEFQSCLNNNKTILDEYKNNIIHNYKFCKFYMNKYNISLAIENYEFFNISTNDCNNIEVCKNNNSNINNTLKQYLTNNSTEFKYDIKYIDNDMLKIFNYKDYKNYIKKKRLKNIFNYTLNNPYIIKNISEQLNNDDSNNDCECLICYNDIKYQVITSCNHNFCSDCFIKILNTNNKNCPYCRQEL